MDWNTSNADPVNRLPRSAFWQFQEAQASIRLAEIAEARQFEEDVTRLRSEYLNALPQIIGEHDLPEYLERHKLRIAAMRSAREKCIPSPAGYANLQQTRERIAQRSTKLIQQSSVDVDQLERLQAEYKTKSSKLLRQTLGAGETLTLRPTDRRGPNQTYRPPYLGWDWYFLPGSSTDSSFSFAHTRADRITGEILSDSSIRLVDADDSDYVYVLCRPRFRIVYTTPSAGEIVALVELESILTSHSGAIENECGYSEVDLTQRMRVYAQRTWPDASARIYAELPGASDYHDDRARSHHWSGSLIDSGLTRSVTLTIPGTVEADEMVGVDVGIETYNHVWSNDCTMESQLFHDYFIREIHLSIA